MTADPGNPASSEAAGSSGPRLGIVGGGHLGRMTAKAALQLGCDVVVLERDGTSPAARLASRSVAGDGNTPAALRELAASADVITLATDHVDAALLAELEDTGATVLPRAHTVRAVQDRLRQKSVLAEAGVPIPRVCAVESPDDVAAAAREFGLPLLLKTRRRTDGGGAVLLESSVDFAPAWQRLGGEAGAPLFAEAFCRFEHELATVVTRGRDGEVAVYPVCELVRKDGICRLVRVPATVPRALAHRGAEMAANAVAALDGVGSFGVEFFLTRDGRSLVHEVVPHVHDAAHYTIEACECSQFENHVRAVLGYPLGSTRLVPQATVQVNLLGAGPGAGEPDGLARALTVPGAHVHVYGRGVSAAGRRMGHVTVLGPSVAAAEDVARRCAGAITFGDGR